MRLTLVIAILFVFVFCSPVLADPVWMSDLIDIDGFIISGDKRFDQFEYSATGDMPPADGVNVIPYTDADGNDGITFQGGFVDLFGRGPSDVLIRYRVTALDPNKLISDAHLAGNPVMIGRGIIQVVETFLPTEPNKRMTIHVVSSGGVDRRVKRVTSVDFDGQYITLKVQKDILALAQGRGSAATLSFVHQTFSQVLVPEPSSVVILLSGLALLGCCVRRFGRGR